MAAGGLLLHAGSKEPQVFNDYFKNKLIGGSLRARAACGRWAGPSALKSARAEWIRAGRLLIGHLTLSVPYVSCVSAELCILALGVSRSAKSIMCTTPDRCLSCAVTACVRVVDGW